VRPPAAIEAVAYFVISEAVSNAVKHSGVRRIGISVAPGNRSVAVMVSDDGRGGPIRAGAA
jgi:signal transduction histidine kinase